MPYGSLSVGTTAVPVPASGRLVIVYNASAVKVYRGTDNLVTTATGTPIDPGGNWEFDEPGCHLIADTAANDCRWTTD